MWRVRDRASFTALAGAPRHRHGPVSVRFRAGDATEPPRVAYAVGRRVGSAVARNRVRRRLRAAVAERGADLVPGGAYLFEAEPSVLTLPFAELRDTVAWLIRDTRERPS